MSKEAVTSAEASEQFEPFGRNKMTDAVEKTLCIYDQVAHVLVLILVVVAVVSAIRAATSRDSNRKVTNAIQVGLIAGVVVVNPIIGIVQLIAYLVEKKRGNKTPTTTYYYTPPPPKSRLSIHTISI